MDFDNLKANGFYLTYGIKTQNWEWFFDRLKGPVYHESVKQLWIFASTTNLQITSFVLGHKITISEKSIAKLLKHDDSGKRCFEMPDKKAILDAIAKVIFQDGKNSSNANNLHRHLRVWFKILLGYIHHRPSINSSDYINIDQKHMLYYLSYGVKMNLPYILTKYLRKPVRETRDSSSNPIKWIPMGRLISDIISESKLVQKLMEVGLTKEVEFYVRKTFSGRNLKNMSLIIVVIHPSETLDRNTVASRRIPIIDYHIFTKEDPPELLASYIVDCLVTCVTPVAYSFDELPDQAPDVYSLKRKKKSKLTDDISSGITSPPTKMSRTFDILGNTMRPEA